MSKSQKGLYMIMLSGIVFGVMPSAVKFCYSQGVTASLAVLFRYASLSLTFIPAVLKTDNLWRNYKLNWSKLMLLSLVGTSTPMLLFTAYKYLPTGVSTTIHFMYPTIVVLICMIFFHERMSKIKMACLTLCAVGALLMAETSGQKINIVGMLIAFLSSITWSCYIVFLNKFDFSPLTSKQVVFFIGVNSLLLISLYAFFTNSFPIKITGFGWVALILSSIVIAVFGSGFFAIGTQYTDAQSSAIASTLEPITSVIVGIVFLNEQLSFRIIIGIAMILTAVILLALCRKKEQKLGSPYSRYYIACLNQK